MVPHLMLSLSLKLSHLGRSHHLIRAHKFRHFIGGTVLHDLIQVLMSWIFTTDFHWYTIRITLVTVMIIHFELIPNLSIRPYFLVTKRAVFWWYVRIHSAAINQRASSYLECIIYFHIAVLRFVRTTTKTFLCIVIFILVDIIIIIVSLVRFPKVIIKFLLILRMAPLWHQDWPLLLVN